jgi:hypothetical protein
MPSQAKRLPHHEQLVFARLPLSLVGSQSSNWQVQELGFSTLSLDLSGPLVLGYRQASDRTHAIVIHCNPTKAELALRLLPESDRGCSGVLR